MIWIAPIKNISIIIESSIRQRWSSRFRKIEEEVWWGITKETVVQNQMSELRSPEVEQLWVMTSPTEGKRGVSAGTQS